MLALLGLGPSGIFTPRATSPLPWPTGLTPLCFHRRGCNICARMTWSHFWRITLVQQWPTLCGVKDTLECQCIPKSTIFQSFDGEGLLAHAWTSPPPPEAVCDCILNIFTVTVTGDRRLNPQPELKACRGRGGWSQLILYLASDGRHLVPNFVGIC
jgi:hypothetical protein